MDSIEHLGASIYAKIQKITTPLLSFPSGSSRRDTMTFEVVHFVPVRCLDMLSFNWFINFISVSSTPAFLFILVLVITGPWWAPHITAYKKAPSIWCYHVISHPPETVATTGRAWGFDQWSWEPFCCKHWKPYEHYTVQPQLGHKTLDAVSRDSGSWHRHANRCHGLDLSLKACRS